MAVVTCSFAYIVPVSATHRCAPHAHPVTELAFCQDACGMLLQAGQRFGYSNHSILISPPNTIHSIENHQEGYQLCLGIQGCGVSELKPGILKASPILVQRFTEIISYMKNNSQFNSLRIDFIAGLIVLDIRDELGGYQEEFSSPSEKVKHLIDASFLEPISLESLADSVFLSPDYLRQLFRRDFGESVTHYLMRRRMEFAVQQLQLTDQPIHSIGEACGFSNVFYFSRAFKKRMGISPAQFRAQSIPGRNQL